MSDTALAPDVLATAADLDVLDAFGTSIKFGSIFEAQKTLVVFIRHFYCGRCMDYVKGLVSVRPEALHEASTKIVLIGCGEPHLIPMYRDFTSFTGEIYADPTTALHEVLGFTYTLRERAAGEPARAYSARWRVLTSLGSIYRALWTPWGVGKQGPIPRNGGELVLGPGQTCAFAHRMQHPEDHTDVAEVMNVAGIAYP